MRRAGRRPTHQRALPGRKLSLQAAAERLREARGSLAPRLLPSTRYVPPITLLDRSPTSRLLPARYSESVLTRIADNDDDLQHIYALDNATNERLLAESNHRPWIAASELVFGVPYARIINAAFAHPHPQGARFSTPARGAWYAAFELATAKAEVLFHRSVQLSEIGWLQREDLDYDHYVAEFTGPFHDLRRSSIDSVIERHEVARMLCLTPGSYIASQQLAAELLEAGSLGVVFPSTRRAGGTCLACFRPEAVLHVRKRDLHRLSWYPDAPATFTRIARDRKGGAALEPLPEPEP